MVSGGQAKLISWWRIEVLSIGTGRPIPGAPPPPKKKKKKKKNSGTLDFRYFDIRKYKTKFISSDRTLSSETNDTKIIGIG